MGFGFGLGLERLPTTSGHESAPAYGSLRSDDVISSSRARTRASARGGALRMTRRS